MKSPSPNTVSPRVRAVGSERHKDFYRITLIDKSGVARGHRGDRGGL